MSPQKLTEKEIGVFREQLLALRARLCGVVTAITDNALSKDSLDGTGERTSMPIHMAEAGSDNYAQEFSLSLMQSGQDRIGEVDAALRRIENGSFGVCEKCGTVIPKIRLHAIPFAIRCVKCASKGTGGREQGTGK